jgi:hypothetical protein
MVSLSCDVMPDFKEATRADSTRWELVVGVVRRRVVKGLAVRRANQVSMPETPLLGPRK